MQKRKLLARGGSLALSCGIFALDLNVVSHPAMPLAYTIPVFVLWRTGAGPAHLWSMGLATLFSITAYLTSLPRADTFSSAAELLGVGAALWAFAGLLEMATQWQRRMSFLESFLQEGLGASGEAVILLDDHGKIESFNTAAENLLGYTKEEILGQSMHMLMPQEQRLVHDKMLLDRTTSPVTAGLRHRYRERDIIHKDGRTIPVAITTGVYEAGGIRKYLGLIVDISRFRDAEKHYRDVANKAHLANANKSTFLASMSHELRTPLNGIIGLLGLIHDQGLMPKEGEYLSLAKTSATALLDIINDVLDLSRLDAGEMEVDAEPFDVSQTVMSVCKLLKPRSDEKNIDLIFDPEALKGFWIIGDCSIFRQVLINLINNAIKYTRIGHVRITVECTVHRDETVEIKCLIADTGRGIAPHDTHKLFKRFGRAGDERAHQMESTGLGLAISKQMMELVGGDIGAESELGVGSTFWFTFPAHIVTDEDARPCSSQG